MKVSKSEVMRSLHVHPSAFKTQLRLLKICGYKALSLTDAIAEKRSNPNSKICALTFDDGYSNFLTHALPLLRTHKYAATIYAVTKMAGETNKWDLDKGISTNRLMSWSDLTQCIRAGMEIGSHGHTHADVTIPTADLQVELTYSKQLLEQKLNVEINSFCYPYGKYDSATIEEMTNTTYQTAVTMDRGISDLEKDQPLALPRIPVTWHTLPHLFLAKLLTQYENNRR